ncbi:HigA family addiction module antitoxin [Kitasatospora sp. NPDC093806]|uniref:HigA family addiction module antitoxin n=1 Tax=Kitasatospora sp. NPDC093806 TaxID=3155075 RepID=UPI003432D7A6
MTPGVDPLAYAPTSVPHPGETLQDTLDELGIPQADLARRTGLSTKHINQVIKGTAALSPDTALLLERTTGVPATLWNSMEAAYRTQQARAEESKTLASRVDWLSRFPLAELVKLRVLPNREKTPANLLKLLDWFGVADPDTAEDVWRNYRTAFRRSTVQEPTEGTAAEYATAVWLRQAELQSRELAKNLDLLPYSKHELAALLPTLRALTLTGQDSWIEELPRLCAGAGVAVVFVPALPKTRVSGATRWLTPEKVMVALSDRFKRDDQFWFSFFHELGHVLLHGKRLTFMDDSENLRSEANADPAEDEANEFAANTLIPPQHAAAYGQLRARPVPLDRVKAFAREAGISPGIVIGRLQHDKALDWNVGNHFKRTVALN